MSYWYLGSPYSKFHAGLSEAHRFVCVEAARLVRCGVPVFSPIAHTHPIAQHGDMDPLDHDIWMPVDRPMMAAATGLIVLKMRDWERSYGLEIEINEFVDSRRPIVYMEPGTVPHELATLYRRI